MASYANTSIRSFVGAQGGFGQSSYNAAKAAGLTDDQIKNQLSASGLQVGSWVSNQLGLNASSVAPTSSTSAATGTVSQSAPPNVNSFRSGNAFNLNSYNAAIQAGLTDDQIRNQLLGSGLTLGTGVQSKFNLPGTPVPIQQLPPSQQQSQPPAASSGSAATPAATGAAAAAPAAGGGTRFAGDALNGGVAAQYLKSGTDIINQVANQNKDNPTIGGLALGKLADIGGTAANTGLAIAYNDAMFSSLTEQQKILEDTKKGNALELMSAEGSIAKFLQKGNNATLRYNTETLASADKYKADKSLEEAREQSSATRYTADKQSEASKYGADKTVDVAREQAGAQRYGYEKQLEGAKYTADQDLAGTRYTADAQRYGYEKQLEGTKYTSDSEERRIGLKGEEDRRTLQEQTMQQLALRRDARGAIASAGRRFYG